jgi:carbon-monoxide dehydrogenase large subunit
MLRGQSLSGTRRVDRVPGSLLGNAVRRVEDPELVRGRGTFVDNLRVDGVLHLAFARSPHPHAEVTRIDPTEALRSDGVVAVFTAADLGLPRYDPFFGVNDVCKRPPLAEGRVRFVGEPVAVVVAESATAAADAVALVDVDYEPLDSVVDPEAALVPGAPLQFEELGSNVATSEGDDPSADPLAGADVVVRARIKNQRVAVAPMEGNAVLAEPANGDHDLLVHLATQMPHGARDKLAEVFDLPAERIRLVAPHVGGAFGGKAGVPPEGVVAVAAARRLGRPTKWTETRSEAQISMHGRDQLQWAELGLRRDGCIVGLRARVLGDCGAYAGFGGALGKGSTYHMAQGVYRIPALSFDAIAAMTNTAPVGAFRGAGRPEAAAMLERIMDIAADELDIDPVELRRRNLLPPGEFPYTTATGATYDSGDFDRPLTEALRIVQYDEMRTEQARRRERGDARQLGIGIACYVEVTGGDSAEFAAVDVAEDGTATIRVGTSSHGQGHATSFAMIVADGLGLPMESVRFVQSDTARVPRGEGTGGSRSLQVGGSAVAQASENVLDQARRVASTMLEAAEADIVLDDTGFHVAGVPTPTVGWREIAAHVAGNGDRLGAERDFRPDDATYPFGAHVSVVEVDVETGQVTPIRHVAVDDCGRVLNPLIVAGQQHGGVAQGIAQALWEDFVYSDDGTPLTGTFADYAIPSAADLPALEVSNTETPSPLNPLGAKGIGESATIGSTPAVQNAVVDAVSHLGVRHVDMPCTPWKVWQAIQAAEVGPVELWREPPAAFADLPLRVTEDEQAPAI